MILRIPPDANRYRFSMAFAVLSGFSRNETGRRVAGRSGLRTHKRCVITRFVIHESLLPGQVLLNASEGQPRASRGPARASEGQRGPARASEGSLLGTSKDTSR